MSIHSFVEEEEEENISNAHFLVTAYLTYTRKYKFES